MGTCFTPRGLPASPLDARRLTATTSETRACPNPVPGRRPKRSPPADSPPATSRWHLRRTRYLGAIALSLLSMSQKTRGVIFAGKPTLGSKGWGSSPPGEGRWGRVISFRSGDS